MRMHELLLAAAWSTPNQPAIVAEGPQGTLETLTYQALLQRVHDGVEALGGNGIGIGDRVLLETDNSASAVAMLLACSWLGATFVPISPDIPTPRLLAIATSVEPALHLQTFTGKRPVLPEPVGLARFGQEGVEFDRKP